ncbi:MAG: dihydrofolate reductase family protein, partial [Solirubrobacterales bacterium]|nr:dihydrofolate reductase family protein [Solirubrobacterales bacterium]
MSTDEIYADLQLPTRSAARPYVVLNMVSTVDGKIALGGRTAGLGSRLDRSLMRRVRAAADAVMVGSATLRAEPVDFGVPEALARARVERGLPPQPLAVTISRRLDLDADAHFFQRARSGSVVFTGDAATAERVAALSDHARIER